MKRFIQRNRSKVIVLCLLIVCIIVGLSTIRISSIDDTRQENATNASIDDLVIAEKADQSTDGTINSDMSTGQTIGDGNQNNQDNQSVSGNTDSNGNNLGSNNNSNNNNNPNSHDNNTANNGNNRNNNNQNNNSANNNNNNNSNNSNNNSHSGNNNGNSNNSNNGNSNSNNNSGNNNSNNGNNRNISDGNGQGQDEYQTDPVDEGKPEPVNQEDQTVTNESFTVYLSIDCKTILDNMDRLDESLKRYVGDGIILKKTPVKCYSGESVWDVLSRECKARGINLESADTPVYGSEYVEAINNIGEFDCGELSGWCYSVNGWFPNYGASRYVLVEGETIEWRYTCDLGRDVGSEWK